MNIFTKIMFCLLVFESDLAPKAGFMTSTAAPEQIELLITKVTRPTHLDVRVENRANVPVRIFRDYVSFGWARWRVIVVRNGKLREYMQNPDREFTKNGPEYNEIPVGGGHAFDFDFSSDDWTCSGECKDKGIMPNDTAILIYDVPMTLQARRFGVWYGSRAAVISLAK